jgi:hypothetical protein
VESISISNSNLVGRLKSLSEELRERLRHECDYPVFYDVVSVELSNKKDYEVNWYADPDLLDKYDSAVREYFAPDKPENQSLLFLPCENLQPGIAHHWFPTGEVSHFRPVTFKSRIEKKITLENFGQPIASFEVPHHKNRWFSRVVKKAGLGFCTFSKIEVTIVNQRFVAAVWIQQRI